MSNQVNKLSTDTEMLIYRAPRHPIAQLDAAPMHVEKVAALEKSLSYRGKLEKKELAIFAIMHMARRSLPYGIWFCKGGREVLFNREYQAIAQRLDGVVSYTDRDEAVQDIERAEMLYGGSCDPCDYLTKHLGRTIGMTSAESRQCRKALLRSMAVLKEFTPREHVSVNETWSLLGR